MRHSIIDSIFLLSISTSFYLLFYFIFSFLFPHIRAHGSSDVIDVRALIITTEPEVSYEISQYIFSFPNIIITVLIRGLATRRKSISVTHVWSQRFCRTYGWLSLRADQRWRRDKNLNNMFKRCSFALQVTKPAYVPHIKLR
jgi:hypothetical protein